MGLYRWFIGGKSWSDQSRLRAYDQRKAKRAKDARKRAAAKKPGKSGSRKNLGFGLYWQ